MRPWTLAILGAVALSLAVPPAAEARLRFGPGAVLGAVAGIFGGFRLAGTHRRHHRSAAIHTSRSPRHASRSAARSDRRPAAGAPPPPVSAPQSATTAPIERSAPPERTASPQQSAAVFWPDAAADLVDYVLFANGNNRFWSYGYDTIVAAGFAASDAEKQQPPRSHAPADRLSDAASQTKTPLAAAALCGATSVSADALVERIDRAVEPNASQRDALEQLRHAVGQAIERITAICPAAPPASVSQRLNAIQDRIWIMHDALLTIRLPFEAFYNSLTDEQRQRLRGVQPQSAETAANATDGRDQTTAGRRAAMCAEPAAGSADWIMGAIEHAAPPREREGLKGLRQSSAAMAQLVAASCPTDPHLDSMGRFAAATDRLNVMLFAVMSMSPMLLQLSDSLDDKQ